MAAFASDPLFAACFGPSAPRATYAPAAESAPPIIDVSALPSVVRARIDDGEKFPGGFGPTELLFADYWTLRARSVQLFERNIYARGLIRRLVTNEINVGLHLEATPEEAILGVPEDGLADWTETVENRHHIWSKDAQLCDHDERLTFGGLQQAARQEALIAGDVLVVLRQDQRTRLPRVQLISGSAVQTPLDAKPRNGNRIVHGVELDVQGRHVAYWVRSPLDELFAPSQRLPAIGEKSGRRLAWLVYGTDKRLDDVRGKPILALVLQSLAEVDRYRDSALRKAVLNSMLAMFIAKGEDKPGTRPITGGAVRRGLDVAADSAGQARVFRTADLIPGLILDELQHGEEPKAFPSHGTDEKFADFEAAIIQAIAWANEVPPEILRLSFSSNYSASQAAINEFKIYLNRIRTTFGEAFCQPIYIEWLLAEVLAQRIDAPGLLDAWRDWALFDKFGAWTNADWAGQIKPAVDLSKLVGGQTAMVEQGFSSRDRATRELTGTKFSKNVQKLKRENMALAEAMKPIKELEAAAKPQPKPAPEERDDDEERDDERAIANVAAS